MPEASSSVAGTLSRHPTLVRAARYAREVDASLERVWENVQDWEHLPWIHGQAFRSIELREEGAWGWRACVGFPGDAEAEIELLTDRARRCYVARTVEGAGAPAEIWTRLTPRSTDRTAIEVEFWLSAPSEAAAAEIGKSYVRLYALLWDQDEAMMQRREAALEARNAPGTSRSGSPAGDPSVDLGSRVEVEKKAPFLFDWEGNTFRLVRYEDGWAAHSIECPHRLGPLEDCVIEAGVLTCPWHGYRFDLGTGRSVDGRALGLRRAPSVSIDPESDRVLAHGERGESGGRSEKPSGV